MEALLLGRNPCVIEEGSIGAWCGVKGHDPTVVTLRADLAVRASGAFHTKVAWRAWPTDGCLTCHSQEIEGDENTKYLINTCTWSCTCTYTCIH